MLIVRNGKIFLGKELVEGSLIVDDGKIKAIVKDEEPYLSKADEVVDAKGLPVIPGGIDIHAHIYDPDYTHHEDWETGTKAAVFGGLTTVFNTPLRMIIDTPSKLKRVVEEGLKNTYANFGVYGGMINDKNYKKAIPKLAENGVIGFRIYTVKPWKASDEAIIEILNLVKKHDCIAMFHAEDDVLIDYGLRLNKNRSDPLAWHEARSDLAEAVAVAKIGFYGKAIGTHIHIDHVTSKIEVQLIRFFKNYGVTITAETCPHYLYFTRDDVARHGNYLKVSPSIKTRADVEALWKAVADGTIDAIASDHAPSTRKEKEVDVWSAWGGIPVIELIIPFTYTYGVRKGLISFSRFIELVSTNPAKIVKLYPKKGVITPGSDADIVVLNTNKPKIVDPENLHHKVDWCPFEGMELYGWPLHVIVNGTIVIRDGELVAKPGIGKYLGEYYKELRRQHTGKNQ